MGRPSSFVGKTIEPFLSGSYTVDDSTLYRRLALLRDTENLALEPSALAGMEGVRWLLESKDGQAYLEKEGLADKMEQAHFMPWGTGGSMVPPEVMEEYYRKGKE